MRSFKDAILNAGKRWLSNLLGRYVHRLLVFVEKPTICSHSNKETLGRCNRRISGMNSLSSKCLVCRKTVEPGAKKCTECDSYQDWTRYIFRYTSVATAILGMIPVVTIAVSLYKIAFSEKSADVRAELVRCNSQQFDIAITNVGEVPAIVSKVTFRSPDTPPQANTFTIRRTGIDPSPTFSVDPADAVKIVSYQAFIGETRTRFPQFPKGATTCKYRITVESVQFELNKKSKELICDCSRS